MTNETGNRLGTADRHLISVIGDQVIYRVCVLFFWLLTSFIFLILPFKRTLLQECFWQE